MMEISAPGVLPLLSAPGVLPLLVKDLFLFISSAVFKENVEVFSQPWRHRHRRQGSVVVQKL